MTAVAVPVDRAARARAVLDRAEAHTGTRRLPWSAPVPALVPTAPVPPALVPHGATTSPAGVPGVREHGRPALPVDPRLSVVMRSLDRGTTVTVAGSTSLLLALLAEASATGSWVAMVGLPGIGVLAADQLGLALERVVLVPDPGPDGPRVLAALLDGMDAVVVGEVTLSDADRRRLSARARERSAVLLTTTPWPGASVAIHATVSRWGGVGRGEGRLRDGMLTVSRYGRGAAARGWSGEVVLPGTWREVDRGGRVDMPRPEVSRLDENARLLHEPAEGRRVG